MRVGKAKFRGPGGVHPAYHKDTTREMPIRDMPLPALLRVSMSQHLGAPAKPTVKKGDAVMRGQKIGEPSGFISAAVHAPTSGTVKAVGEAPLASGRGAPAVDIEPDGADAWAGEPDPRTWRELEPGELLAVVAEAGIAGMGGAGFPTHVKLSPPTDKPIDTLIVNGAECEPFLTADHRLMMEQADQIAEGALVIRKILGAEAVWVAVEDNKPEAIAALDHALGAAGDDVNVAVLPTAYPQGAEKQQILAITGREVPSGGLPMDVGTVVENVGTTYAVWDAVIRGRPLIERITTVTGPPVQSPANLRVRIGTLYADLVEFCGGLEEAAKIISGGPMMGLAQGSLDAAVTKTTSGLLALPAESVTMFASMPCISCGRCVAACPTALVPSELSQMLEAEDYDAAEAYNVADCIECGCCAFVCPARRPLVQHMRQGKSRVMLKRRQEQAKK